MSDIENLADRAVICLLGDDRRSFLQGLITQDVAHLDQGHAIFAALLTPQGKILFDFFVADCGDAVLIDCDAGSADELIKRLKLYKLRAKVDIERAPRFSVGVSASKPTEHSHFEDPRHSALGYRVIAEQRFMTPGGNFKAKRIALGIPECGADFSGNEIFLTDANYDALNGVSYKKGCFIGQEVTSRMKRKGDIRRRTLIAEFDGPSPEKGAAITAGSSTLGVVMSAAEARALALIRLDRWEKAKTEGIAPTCDRRTLHLLVPDYLKQG